MKASLAAAVGAATAIGVTALLGTSGGNFLGLAGQSQPASTATSLGSADITAADLSSLGAATPTPGQGPRARLRQRLGARAGRILHGEVTVQTKQGVKVLDLQSGTISAVSPTSLTMRSTDGFTQTYVLTAATKVRSKGQLEAVSDLKAGERAMVVAVKDGTTLTARLVRCVTDNTAAAAPSSGT